MRPALACSIVLPFLKRMDAMGFHAIDILDPEVHRISLPTFGEDPYDRLARAARLCTATPLNVVVAGRCLLTDAPADDGTVQETLSRLAAAGARSLTCLDPVGDIANASAMLRAARDVGLKPVGGLLFAVSRQHTIAFYVAAARAVVQAGAAHICLADPAGLLDPDRARTLIPALRETIGGLPLEIRLACRSGLAEKTCFDAIELGADLIATATAPLAGGGMAPPADHLAESLARFDRAPTPSPADLAVMADYFEACCATLAIAAEPHELPDPDADRHQLPGLLVAALHVAAQARGIGDRTPTLHAEIAAIRGDLGVVSAMYGLGRAMVRQAVEHVASGRRYATLEPLLARCLRGEFGQTPAAVDTGFEQMVARGEIAEAPAAVTDVPRPLSSGAGADEVDASTPLAQLAAEIARRPWVHEVVVRKGGFKWSYEAPKAALPRPRA